MISALEIKLKEAEKEVADLKKAAEVAEPPKPKGNTYGVIFFTCYRIVRAFEVLSLSPIPSQWEVCVRRLEVLGQF